MSNILITGVSTGIGFFCAKKFAEEGYTVFGSLRKQLDVDRVCQEIGENFKPLIFDVTDPTAIKSAAAKVQSEVGNDGLALLINNAGIAVNGPLAVLEVDDYRHQFEVNVFGLLEVTKAFLPLLGAKINSPIPPGKIMNISSISGMRSWPFLTPYSASKSAVDSISEGLRREMLLYGIDVISINPGPIKTAIWGKVEAPSPQLTVSDYAPFIARFSKAFLKEELKAMPGEVFANKIFKIFKSRKPKTFNVIMKNKFIKWTLMGWIPDRMMDRLLKKMLKM